MPRHPPASRAAGPRTTSPRNARLRLLVVGGLAITLVLGISTLLDARRPGAGAPTASATDPAATPTPAGRTGPSYGGLSTPTGTPNPSGGSNPSGAGRTDPVLGVFRGGGGSGELAAFGEWLGRRPRYGLTFGDPTSWATIADPTILTGWDASPYRVVYSVPMLPSSGPDSIAEGATGAYDRYFVQLGRRMVAHGQQDAILRIGWEFNIKNSYWATRDHEAFKAYWRHIVTAFRSVPGEQFQFDWNPVNAHTTYDGSLYYPGGRYVDYIGIDVYDVSWIDDTYPWPKYCSGTCLRARREAVWDYIENNERGLAFWSAFAAQMGKPLSIPEWGMWTRPDGRGGGDDPIFIRNMHAFITDPRNDVAYQLYFDFDAPDGQHGLETTFPKGGALFRKLFGTPQ